MIALNLPRPLGDHVIEHMEINTLLLTGQPAPRVTWSGPRHSGFVNIQFPNQESFDAFWEVMVGLLRSYWTERP